MRLVFTLSLSLLAAFPTESFAQTPVVKLAFVWRPGLQGSVVTTRTLTSTTDTRSSSSATWRYNFRVDHIGENLLVRFTDPSIEFPAASGKLSEARQLQILGQLGELAPDYVVTKSGGFVRVHDPESFRTRLLSFIAKNAPAGLDSTVVKNTVTQLASETSLNNRAAEAWNLMVRAWQGAGLRLTQKAEFKAREPVAFLGGETILMNYTQTASNLARCSRGGGDRECVELEMRGTPDAEDLKRALPLIEARLRKGSETLIYRKLEFENVLQLVTEPSGLVPHEATLTRTVRGTAVAKNGEVSIESVDITKSVYTYP